jgi:hypothetical protein
VHERRIRLWVHGAHGRHDADLPDEASVLLGQQDPHLVVRQQALEVRELRLERGRLPPGRREGPVRLESVDDEPGDRLGVGGCCGTEAGQRAIIRAMKPAATR